MSRKFATTKAMLFGATLMLPAVLGGAAQAQMAAELSEGCMAANNGDYDFSSDAGSPLTSFLFSGASEAVPDFFEGEILTFSLVSDGNVPVATATDDNTAMEVFSAMTAGSGDYTIPADGARDFELELDTEDFDAEITVRCAPPAAPEGVSDEEFIVLGQHVIRNFLYRRANALLSEEPDRARIIRKKPGVLWDENNHLNLNANQNGASADFAMSAPPVWGNRFDLWVEGHYTSYKTDNGAQFEGDFGVLYLGLDYLLNENLLIGALGQLDWADDEAPLLGEAASGNGWMAGPYLSARMSQNVFLDLRAAWGRSSNSYTIEGLVTDDEFDTSRWLLRGALTGNKQMGDWRITPTASISYMEETQDEFVSSYGPTIPEQTVALGRAAIEPEFAYRYVTADGTLIEPQFKISGLWDFETPEGLSIPGWAITTDEFRMKLEAGLMFAFTNGFALRASGMYDGIAAPGYEAYGGRLWFDIPFGGPTSPAGPPSPPAPPAAPPAAPSETDVAFLAGKANLSGDAYSSIAAAWSDASGGDVSGIVIDAYGPTMALAEQRGAAVRQALIDLGAPASLITVNPAISAQDIAIVTIIAD